jgi:ATP-dependent RNA helicase RhlE
MNFEDFGLAPQLVRAVAAAGYETPSPIQVEAIPHCMEGRDVLGCAQTGTGKTAAFALPILHRLLEDPVRGVKRHVTRALVLSPTRELTSQIAENFEKYARRSKLRTMTIFGGVSQYWQVKNLERGVDIIVATPGRLLDLIRQNHVDLGWVETLVLDEADHMLDMGFLPDVQRIIEYVPKERQALLFSATMPGPIRELANKILRDPVSIRIAPEKPTTELVDQKLCFVAQNHKPELLQHLVKKLPDGPTLVFVRTKHSADQLVKKLSRVDIHSEAIHGNKTQTSRQRTLDHFKSGETKILIATDIAARGIDVSGISYVFNYDMPMVPETYVHRIGRTGRAGQTGTAYSFCGNHEADLLRAVQKHLTKKIPVLSDQPQHLVEDWLQAPDPAPRKRGQGGSQRTPKRASAKNGRGFGRSGQSRTQGPGNGSPKRRGSDTRGSEPATGRSRSTARTAPKTSGPKASGSNGSPDGDGQRKSRQPTKSSRTDSPKRSSRSNTNDDQRSTTGRSSRTTPKSKFGDPGTKSGKPSKSTQSRSAAANGGNYESLRDRSERKRNDTMKAAEKSKGLRGQKRR